MLTVDLCNSLSQFTNYSILKNVVAGSEPDFFAAKERKEHKDNRFRSLFFAIYAFAGILQVKPL